MRRTRFAALVAALVGVLAVLVTASPASATTPQRNMTRTSGVPDAGVVSPDTSSIDIGGGAAHLHADLTFTGKNSFVLTNVYLCDKKDDNKGPRFKIYDQVGPYPVTYKDPYGHGNCASWPDGIPWVTSYTVNYVQLHVYACSPSGSCTAGEWSVKHDNPYA